MRHPTKSVGPLTGEACLRFCEFCAVRCGYGTELGREGLEEFTQATIINMAK